MVFRPWDAWSGSKSVDDERTRSLLTEREQMVIRKAVFAVAHKPKAGSRRRTAIGPMRSVRNRLRLPRRIVHAQVAT